MSSRYMAEVAEQASGDLSEACDGAAGTISRNLIEGAADREETALGNTMETEAGNTQGLRNVLSRLDDDPDPAAGELSPAEPAPETAPSTGRPDDGPVEDQGPDVPEAGQPASGVSGTETGDTDPVDVVSGQLLASAVDLLLPGVLPLVLRRAYASGYQHGALFGPGWSSTLDIRLIVDGGGVRFLGDDAQALDYGVPPSLGLPAYPVHGARWPLTVDRHAGLYRVENPQDGLTWAFPFGGVDAGDGIRPLSSIADRNGNQVVFVRDEEGFVTEVAHSGGYRVAVDTAGAVGRRRISGLRLLDRTNDDAGTTLLEFGYDQGGRLIAITDSTGMPYQYEWDEQDRITAWIDRNGYQYRYTYDQAGRVVAGEGDGGYLSVTLDYDPAHRVTTVTDSLGHPTEFHYDRFQKIVKTVDPLGGTVQTTYDRYGRLLSRTDQLGRITNFHRDGDGNPIRIEYADGSEVSARYDSTGQPTRVIVADGTVWQYAYDERGNLVSLTNPAGGVTRYAYADAGALVSSIDPVGRARSFEADRAGLHVAATDSSGGRTVTERDAFGRVVTLTDPTGAVTGLAWDTEGRLVRQVNPDGTVEQHAYDPDGNEVAYTDAVARVTRYEYGPFRVPRARIDPDGSRYGYTHDSKQRLTQVTGPTGAAWTYAYDAAGRLVREQDFNDRVLTYRHDLAGRLVERGNADGRAVEYVRDELGRLVARHTRTDSYRYIHDRMGRLLRIEHGEQALEYSRDVLGRVVAESFDGRELRREYDAVGHTVRRTTASGTVSDWEFDEHGQPRTLAIAGGSLSFAHDALGREVRRSLGGLAQLSQSFDVMGRLTGQDVHALDEPAALSGAATAPLVRRAYRYRGDGLVEHVADLARGDRALTSDQAGRVTGIRAETWSETYAYDALGNLVEAHNNGSPEALADTSGARELTGTLLHRAGRTSYDYDDQGRLIRQVRRTLSGQRKVWTYTWNGDDQLTAATLPDGSSWYYDYDPLGRRVGKREQDRAGAMAGRVRFTWDGPRLAEQCAVGPDGRETTITWEWKPGTWQPIAQARRTGSENHPAQDGSADTDAEFWSIVTDLTGTPAELVDQDGAVVWQQSTDLWGTRLGVVAAGDADCPLRGPGQYHDAETGLYYNYHRYYDPATARYISADPLGQLPSPNDYAYVENPYDSCDPFGLAKVRNPLGQYASDPARTSTVHNRSTEYPHNYSQSTHDTMVKRWTDEGRALPGDQVPRDPATGARIPRDQLTWRDEEGNKINFTEDDPLTYDHDPMVVEHWNGVGYDTNKATRKAFYDDPDHMTPMLKSQNSSHGAQSDETYRQDTGPNYTSC